MKAPNGRGRIAGAPCSDIRCKLYPAVGRRLDAECANFIGARVTDDVESHIAPLYLDVHWIAQEKRR